MTCLRLIVIVVLMSRETLSVRISCKSESGNDLDWFVNYKLPKIEKESHNLGKGEAYLYLTKSPKWKLSTQKVSSPASMMGKTLQSFYENKKDLTYLLYNDEHPKDSASSSGHTKGVVIFDNSSGFWLVHSIPKFPDEIEYIYPSSGLENGQSILCVTFDIRSLNEIGKQLLYNGPSIYAKSLNNDTAKLLDPDVKSLFSNKPSFIRKAPFQRISKLRSRKNMAFLSFAKDNQFNDDLYSALMAPALESSLLTETWRRGSGTPLSPSCPSAYQVRDVRAVNVSASLGHGQKEASVSFSSTEDHSKWAIADPGSLSANRRAGRWVCVGDINRMESQKKRGGGSLCFSSAVTWRAFNSVIAKTDDCGK